MSGGKFEEVDHREIMIIEPDRGMPPTLWFHLLLSLIVFPIGLVIVEGLMPFLTEQNMLGISLSHLVIALGITAITALLIRWFLKWSFGVGLVSFLAFIALVSVAMRVSAANPSQIPDSPYMFAAQTLASDIYYGEIATQAAVDAAAIINQSHTEAAAIQLTAYGVAQVTATAVLGEVYGTATAIGQTQVFGEDIQQVQTEAVASFQFSLTSEAAAKCYVVYQTGFLPTYSKPIHPDDDSTSRILQYMTPMVKYEVVGRKIGGQINQGAWWIISFERIASFSQPVPENHFSYVLSDNVDEIGSRCFAIVPQP